MSELNIRKNKRQYRWRPSRSTPHVKAPLAELPAITEFLHTKGVTSITDFGCGLGRNLRPLLRSFGKVVAVEDETNVKFLRQNFRRFNVGRLNILTWDEYNASTVSTGASLLCCVLHTVPRADARRDILTCTQARLAHSGWIVLVCPRNDSKYRGEHLADAEKYDGGIVRLHNVDGTFSFYRNFSVDEVKGFLRDLKCVEIERLSSPRRTIFIGRLTDGGK